MYIKIKQLIIGIVPRKTLFRHEPKFRFLLYQLYRGHNYECNVCGKKLKHFILLDNQDKLCPYCGSLSRTRRLYDIISNGYLTDGVSVLDFSPSRSIYRILKKNKHINYVTTDLSGDFIADHQYDITNMDVADATFSLILCYHILEHIEKDGLAMSELFRILKPGGVCFVQTPFKEGDAYEDFTIVTQADRLKHFGQEDHVRIYSVDTLKNRLTKAGFEVRVQNFAEVENNEFGFSTSETVLICAK